MDDLFNGYGLTTEWQRTLAKYIMEGFPQPGEIQDSSADALAVRLQEQGEGDLARWLRGTYNNKVVRAIEILNRCELKGRSEERSIFTALIGAYIGKQNTLTFKKFFKEHSEDWREYYGHVGDGREGEKKYPSERMADIAFFYEDLPSLNNKNASSLCVEVIEEEEDRIADEIDTYIDRLIGVYNRMGFAPITKPRDLRELMSVLVPEMSNLQRIEASRSSSAPPPSSSERVWEARDSMGAVVPV